MPERRAPESNRSSEGQTAKQSYLKAVLIKAVCLSKATLKQCGPGATHLRRNVA